MTAEEMIDQKIAASSGYFNSLPGVVIIHHLQHLNVMFMSDNGLQILGLTMKELHAMGAEYHKRYFNQEEAKEYIPKITGMLERNNDDEYISFFQEIKTGKEGNWSLWLTSVEIFMRDENGQPILLISNSIPVDPEHNFSSKVERLLEENSFLRQNNEKFASLSKREKEILKLAALGFNNTDIASQLYLSEETIKTHRRNIRKKLRINNKLDLLKFAHAFDML